MESNENKKKTMILTIVAVSCLLIAVIGATYAYFQIIATANATNLNAQGSTDTMPKGTLVTNITALKINLDADLMSKENAGVTYYATESGVPVTSATEGSGKYVLATASLNKEGLTYDCGYSYIVTATSKKAITDGSDADVKIRITGSDGYSETYTLQEILDKGSKTYNGTIKGLTYGENQKIYVEAYVENANKAQDDLAGNEFTFTLALVNNSFKCDLPTPTQTASEELIASGELWSSGLEGDGYRYTGSGNYDSATTPNNFICFGTSDATECKNNEAKYMYRIIGVFEGIDGNQHLKLISLKQLSLIYAWNEDVGSDVAWENSDMYKGLNGSYFLTNTTYDYLQNNTWLNKIEDWTWSAVNTKTYSDSGPDYYNSLTLSQIYLHEMNRSSKTSSIGSWTNPTAKIGLMYASDYTLSLGSSALSITGSTYDNRATLKTGWMNPSNNDTTASTLEWTLSRVGDDGGNFSAWDVNSAGDVFSDFVDGTAGARPVFHLTSDARINGGNGSYSNPYILE